MITSNYLISIKKKKKIIGRGVGSGRGKTAGRGTKGQKARKSGHTRPGFEGGQTPIYRRLPKQRNFKSRKKLVYRIVNLAALEKNEKITNDQVIDFSQEKLPVKILGNGDFTKKLTIKATAFSKSAQEKITQVNGNFQVVKK